MHVARRTLEPHRLMGDEPEQPDQERQPELRSTESISPPNNTDGKPGRQGEMRTGGSPRSVSSCITASLRVGKRQRQKLDRSPTNVVEGLELAPPFAISTVGSMQVSGHPRRPVRHD